MTSRRFLLAILFLYFSAASHAQQITCSNWKFFRAPDPWVNFGAAGIDSSRTVVGGVSLNQSTILHGFTRSSDGTYHYYLVPQSISTGFQYRSDLGVNVGYYTDSAYITHGLIVSGRRYVTVDYPGDAITELTSINKAGTIIGYHDNPNVGTSGTFRLKDGIFKDISYPGSNSTNAKSINDNGVIVGSYVGPTDSIYHGFVLQNSNYTTLDNPKADRENGTKLQDINNSGAIVGWYYVGPIGHSFVYKDGVFADIDPPNGSYTLVSGINNLGDVTGNTNLPSGFTMFTAHCR
jgi:hypothetical protein